jgi:hypothetical protein
MGNPPRISSDPQAHFGTAITNFQRFKDWTQAARENRSRGMSIATRRR